MRELLTDTIAFMPPTQALDHLTPEEAERRFDGTSHSIAEIVAHLEFWMNWFYLRCDGREEPMVRHAAQGWPAVASGSWPVLHQKFFHTLDKLVAIGDDHARLDQPLSPPIEFPPLAAYTIRDALVHVATHTAHHLGQIIVLRQLMGRWPPPSGSYTW